MTTERTPGLITKVWGELFVFSAYVHSRRLTRFLYVRYIASKKRGIR